MQIIAHRGASAYAPENTESAIRLAAAQGATWIEFDVRTSKDNIAVLMHDSTLQRTSNGSGKLIDKTFKELKELDFGSWFSADFYGEPILSFVELIRLCRELNLFMQVELKPDVGYERELITAIKSDIDNENALTQCLFSSFNQTALCELKAQIPDAKIAILVEIIPHDCFEKMLATGATMIHFWNKNINTNMLEKIHKANITTRSYTVNDVKDAHYLKSLGVSAIFTDYPDTMLALDLE